MLFETVPLAELLDLIKPAKRKWHRPGESPCTAEAAIPRITPA